MKLPVQVSAVPRFISSFSGGSAVIGPSAKDSDKKAHTVTRGGTFPACGGVFTMPCPAGSTTTCCDPDMELCYNGACYPFV
jgi:hypothetical protein